MTYVYEDTAFVIDETVEHEECPTCKGGTLPPPQMTTVYSRVLTSSGVYEDNPFFHEEPPLPDKFAHLAHGYACNNKDCYHGKFLTPYERKMQKIVYELSGKLHCAKSEATDLKATVEKFETATLIGRLATAAAGTLPRFTVFNLPGHDLIIRRSPD